MNMSYTVEQVSRILSRLGLGFSNDSAKRLVDSKLKRVERPNSRYNTSYNYLVYVKSLEEYLINEVGLDTNVVYEAVYGARSQ
ncbi:hypothetical protein GCM10007425_17800 [Lysinibacillus alkalisoli]|uniref:Uncharacterized protein n=1 Tax=Lysinibacillus alkalisoli TaxID=1911548 RepID=A0A917LGZ4_9BACI|nr:hypothetical protein [Lysinibacillus alkalisoli]GGG23804.1 hypothetical protein GCM10007425_17800 [Lysinibacillus alkalisoli]